jgi:ERCC4-type nuclease
MADFSGRFCPGNRQRHVPRTEHPLVVLVDSREQLELTPYFSEGVRTEVVCLETGDYSAKGVSEVVRIERKAIGDFVSCVTTSRERFFEQMQRLAKYPVRALVIESDWHALSRGLYRSKVISTSVTGTLLAVMVDYQIPVLLCGTPEETGQAVERILRRVVRKSEQRDYLHSHYPSG